MRPQLRTLLAAALLLAGSGVDPTRAASAPSAPAIAPVEDPLKAVFEALPEQDRRAVQEALIWVGAYTAAISGNYGPRTREALGAYARDARLPPLAVLDPAGRDGLQAAAKAAKAVVGFAPVKDKRAGLALSLPQKILVKVTPIETGTRYASADGSVALDTLSRLAGDEGLQGMFDRMSASSDNRTVTYKFSRPDFFVVTGDTQDGKFYSRYAVEPSAAGKPEPARLIRGFSVSYLKSDARRMDRITIAVAASFDPFPAAPAPTAPAVAGKAPAAAAAPDAGPALQAVIVAPGLALTVLAQGCANPKVGGAPAVIKASDPRSGLALLSIASPSAPQAVVADDPDGPYFALFRQGDAVAVAPATIRRTTSGPVVSGPLQQTVAGAPIVARSGALAGMVATPARRPPAIGSVILEGDYAMVGARDIKALLDRAGVTQTPGSAATLADTVRIWAPLIRPVACELPRPAN